MRLASQVRTLSTVPAAAVAPGIALRQRVCPARAARMPARVEIIVKALLELMAQVLAVVAADVRPTLLPWTGLVDAVAVER